MSYESRKVPYITAVIAVLTPISMTDRGGIMPATHLTRSTALAPPQVTAIAGTCRNVGRI